jgi:hypothetical protein
MGRINIEMPQHFSFVTYIPIRVTDLNYGGHVGHVMLLSIIHEARVQFLRHYGYQELDLAGVALIMSEVAILFKSQVPCSPISTYRRTAILRLVPNLPTFFCLDGEHLIAVFNDGSGAFPFF